MPDQHPGSTNENREGSDGLSVSPEVRAILYRISLAGLIEDIDSLALKEDDARVVASALHASNCVEEALRHFDQFVVASDRFDFDHHDHLPEYDGGRYHDRQEEAESGG